MIYCPYVLIKLFQQTDFEKESGEREEEGRGIEQRIQTRCQKRAGNKNEHTDKCIQKCSYEEQRYQETKLFLKQREGEGETERGY